MTIERDFILFFAQPLPLPPLVSTRVYVDYLSATLLGIFIITEVADLRFNLGHCNSYRGFGHTVSDSINFISL